MDHESDQRIVSPVLCLTLTKPESHNNGADLVNTQPTHCCFIRSLRSYQHETMKEGTRL